MRVLRGLGGALLWILASLLGLVGVVLCVTVVLIPVGLVVLRLARKLYSQSFALLLPRAFSHPVKESKRRLPGLFGGKATSPVSALPRRKRKSPWSRTKKRGRKLLDKVR